MYTEKLWVEKYRPKTIDECVLPRQVAHSLKNIVASGNMPNLLLEGPAGCGKTTVARAMCNEMDMDSIFVNASESGNIDTLRTKIRDFVSTVSLNGKHKVVILDEADYLNAQSTQPALRGFMEEFSENARFILTCNFKDRLLEPLQSRCSLISFVIPQDERSQLGKLFLVRIMDILKTENIEYEKPVLVQMLKRYFPDYRKMLNSLQQFSAGGKLDGDVLAAINHTPIKELVGFLKEKQYNKVSDWVESTEFDQESVFEEFRKNRHEIFAERSRPDFDITAWQFAESATRVQNPKINMQGFLVSIMQDCEFL